MDFSLNYSQKNSIHNFTDEGNTTQGSSTCPKSEVTMEKGKS